MNSSRYGKVCYRTEQREEKVLLRNIKNGQVGYSFGCTQAGETVQIKLPNGEFGLLESRRVRGIVPRRVLIQLHPRCKAEQHVRSVV